MLSKNTLKLMQAAIISMLVLGCSSNTNSRKQNGENEAERGAVSEYSREIFNPKTIAHALLPLGLEAAKKEGHNLGVHALEHWNRQEIMLGTQVASVLKDTFQRTRRKRLTRQELEIVKREVEIELRKSKDSDEELIAHEKLELLKAKLLRDAETVIVDSASAFLDEFISVLD